MRNPRLATDPRPGTSTFLEACRYSPGGVSSAAMMVDRWIRLALLATLLAVACAPTNSGAGDRRGPVTSGVQPGRNLVLLAQAEPDSVASKSVRRTGGRRISATLRLFNAGLAIHDERETRHPYLAEALPQLNTDSWQVFSDGRTQTTYVLRPGLTWHDGAPLSAEDFVFAWRVYSVPELGVAAIPPVSYLEEVVAADARTVVFRWRQPYLAGGRLEPEEFQALPRHILAYTFDHEERDAFVAHPFWGSAYVGLGPYRLDHWALGSFMDGSAFAGHALGQPRIDRLRLHFISDPNTALAMLLSGEAHATIDDPIRLQQAVILRREWSAPSGRSGGTVLLGAAQVRLYQVQMKPEFAVPRALLDVRARRALVHALDRQALVDGLLDGHGEVAHTLMSPQLRYYADIDRALTKYPYDLRRTEQLMGELGFTRGPDGIYASPTEGRFDPEVRVNAAGQNEAEGTIAADSLRRGGMDASVHVIPQVLASDAQFRATFPTLTGTGNVLSPEPPIANLRTSQIPTADNRWRGNNRGGWSNTAFERLAEAYDTTLDSTESERLVVQMMQLISDEVPAIPVYYNLAAMAYVAGLHGPLLSASTDGAVWNVHEWEFR